MLPSASKRIGAKAEIQIVGQHPDGEEDRVGLERTARHVFHAEADFQILDAVLARVAALRVIRPFNCGLLSSSILTFMFSTGMAVALAPSERVGMAETGRSRLASIANQAFKINLASPAVSKRSR